MGFAARIMFLALLTAGGIVSLQMGLSMASVLNPLPDTSDSVMTQFYTILIGMTFLAMNGDVWLIASLARSFDLTPLGTGSFTPSLVQSAIGDLFTVMQVGLQIAMPVAATLVVSDVILGVLSKALPQLNVFVLSMPLNILLGLLALIGSVAGTILLVGHLTDQVPNVMLDLVGHS